MKTDNEMYQSVLSKRNEYRRKKERRICIIKRTGPVFACLCLILGLGYWIHIGNKPIVPSAPDNVSIATSQTTSSESTESISTAPCTFATTKTAQAQTDINSISKTTVSSTALKNTYTASASTKESTSQAILTTIKAETAARTKTTATYASVVTNITDNIQTVSTLPNTAITSIPVTGGNMDFEGMGSDDGYDFNVTAHTNVSASSTTTATVTTISPTSITTVPTTDLPINEEYGLGIIDGYDGWYINTFRISSDHVGEYMGVIVMRSPKLPFLDAKAYRIKDTDSSIAIAITFEGYDGYYLYRSNKTTISVIKELFPDDGSNLKERTFFYE
jgi:hypothetical protein